MKRLVLLIAALLPVACGGPESAGPEGRAGEVIAREVFMSTFVELRMEALDNTPMVVTDEERERILAEHEVTEVDLRTFVEVHGSRLEYMRDLWADIEARVLSRINPEADSVAGSEDSRGGPR